MRFLVLGAGKGIGAEFTKIALEAGHDVTAFSRNVEQASQLPRLELVAGDVTQADALRPVLTDVDVVISAIGLGKDPRRLVVPTTLFSDGARALLSAMPEAEVTRLFVITGFGAGESKAAMSWIERTGHRAILGRAYADKDVQERLIQDSSLDWTIVRPGILTNGPRTGRYRVLSDPEEWRNGTISRADVADYILDAAVSDLHRRQSVVLVR